MLIEKAELRIDKQSVELVWDWDKGDKVISMRQSLTKEDLAKLRHAQTGLKHGSIVNFVRVKQGDKWQVRDLIVADIPLSKSLYVVGARDYQQGYLIKFKSITNSLFNSTHELYFDKSDALAKHLWMRECGVTLGFQIKPGKEVFYTQLDDIEDLPEKVSGILTDIQENNGIYHAKLQADDEYKGRSFPCSFNKNILWKANISKLGKTAKIPADIEFSEKYKSYTVS